MISANKSATLLLCFLGGAASTFAIPYASQIRSETSGEPIGTTTKISYFLNEEADSVTVSLLDNGTTIASFAGPTQQGANSLTWNGTVDNADGNEVGAGTLGIVITAEGSSAEWKEIASNRSQNGLAPHGTVYEQLYSGFAPNDCVFVTDQDSEFFGIGICPVASATPRQAAAIALNSDASVHGDTDGYGSRIFRAQALEALSTIVANKYWCISADPDDSSGFFISGQDSEPPRRLWYGDLQSSATARSADPSGLASVPLPKSIAVHRDGNKKLIYFCSGSTLYRGTLDGDNNITEVTSSLVNFQAAGRYVRRVDFDAAGNMYMVSRNLTSDRRGGILFRWNADRVNAAETANLREEGAAWQVAASTTMLNMMGPAIAPNGDVYIATVGNGFSETTVGIFYAGNVATGHLYRSLGTDDMVVSFSEIGNPPSVWSVSTSFFDLRCDPVGNLVAIDRDREQIRIFGPPGTHVTHISAPPSQVIHRTSAVDGWGLY